MYQNSGPNENKIYKRKTPLQYSLPNLKLCQNLQFQSKKILSQKNMEQKVQILDCFNNLSVVDEQQNNKNAGIMKCKKVFRYSDDGSELLMFSSINESIQNSFVETSLEENLLQGQKANQIKSEHQQQYSFNGQLSVNCSNFHKNTQNKSSYKHLIQKIDNFLVRDFAEQNIMQTKKNQQKACFQVLAQKNIGTNTQDFRKQDKEKPSEFMNILEEQSTVRQKLDFLSSYAESLEEENMNLRGQIKNYQNLNKKIQTLEKLVYEKDIVIKFLTIELQKRNEKKIVQDNSNKENRQITSNITKQRKTVSALDILNKKSSKHPPKYRASHQVSSFNNQIESIHQLLNQPKQRSENISGNSCKSKSNSFMRKIFKRQSQNTEKCNYNEQNINVYGLNIIEILKQENYILQTKLNILYGDFKQIIDKYNQVLTEKNICKEKCCKTVRNQTQQNQVFKNLGQTLQFEKKSVRDKNLHSLNQMNILIQKLKDYSQANHEQQAFLQNKQGNDSLCELFSKKDLQYLRKFQIQYNLTKTNFLPYSQTDTNKTLRTKSILSKVQDSQRHFSNYQQNIDEKSQRQTFMPNLQIFTQRQKIPSRHSKRQSKAYNN